MASTTALKLSHLSLGVTNLDASEKFYRDVLGLETERRGGEVWVKWSDFLLVLDEANPQERGKFHFGFQVPSASEVDYWSERCKAAGAQVLSGPHNRDGGRAVFVVDPDNYTIEFYFDQV